MKKNVNDFRDHLSVFNVDLGTIDTNCLVQAVNDRYSDYIECESANRRCIRDGEPLELEAEAWEAKEDIKAALDELLSRHDGLVRTLASYVHSGREHFELYELQAMASLFHKDGMRGIIDEARELTKHSKPADFFLDGYVPSSWKEWAASDGYIDDDDYDDGYDDDDDYYDDDYDDEDDDDDYYNDYDDDDDWDYLYEVNKEQENDDGVYK